MDGMELLGRLGEVEPVDEAVLDAALHKLAVAIGPAGDAPAASHPVTGRVLRGRPRLIIAAAAAALTAAAAVTAVALVTGLGHPGSVPAGSNSASLAQRASVTPSPGRFHGAPTVAAVLTAFSASAGDILEVSRAVYGEGSCCKAVILISPAMAAPGATVRARVESFSLAGTRLADMALTYAEPATAPPAPAGGCAAIFSRTRVAGRPLHGVPGMETFVNYPTRQWATSDLPIQAATVPSAAGLRSCLRDGQWRVAGRGVLGGLRVLELVTPDGSGRLWVSAATFLPYRLTETSPAGFSHVTFTFRFLPPTAASMSLLTVRIPDGFSRQTIPG